MKIAVTGKGGVGKTTVSALLSLALRRAGHEVLAIDADPDSNLLATMGHPDPASVKPLVELKDLIEERTGVKPGTTGGMFRLNPLVEDIPASYAVEIGGVRVLVAGAVKKGGSGCYCPENALLRALVSHLLMEPRTALVLDMEAGIEHLSRGTVRCVDQLLIVVDPGRRAVETARRIAQLARDVGLTRVGAVANKVRLAGDEQFVRNALGTIPVCGVLPYDDRVCRAEVAGGSIAGASAAVERAVELMVTYLDEQRPARES